MLNRIWIPSPNYSSRQGADVRLIVLHSAEGARTIGDLGHYFASMSVQASSHVGADDQVNTIGEYVKRDRKAWTQSAYNPVSVSVEMCAFSSWDVDEWHRHPNMLDNVARWIAEEADHFKIPIVKLNSLQAQGVGRGVCFHSDLGSAGGGHSDPGPGFPINYVLTSAIGASTYAQEENSLIASATSESGTLHVFELKDGWIWYTYQPAGRISWNGAKEGVGIAGMSRFAEAKDVVSISAEKAGDGTLHVFGRKKDGSVVFTYQKSNMTSWLGGQPGKSPAGLRSFAPAPRG